MAIKAGINGFGRIGRIVPGSATGDSELFASRHSGDELTGKGKSGPEDRVFLMIFFAVLGLVVASLGVSCLFAVSTKNQKLITDLSETTLWVFRDGFLLIIGLLAHLLLRRLSK
jgi:hypothetical protein